MWKDSFDLGIPLMDIQHRKLIDMIETAMSMMTDAEDDVDCYDEIADVLRNLESYTIEHFKDEEALMALKGYTHLESHQKKHNDFVEKIHEFLESSIDDHQRDVLDEGVRFLLEWLVEHISCEDKKYVAVMM